MLYCHLCMLVAQLSFVFTAYLAAGTLNSVADGLSQYEFQRICQLAPQAVPAVMPVPPSFLALLPVV